MSIFAIGDLHLSFDERVEKPMDVFGEAWRDHASRVKENWEKMIGAEDTVLIPGDISWGLKLDEAMADFAWIHELPGRKILTKGNHDLWWGSVSRLNGLFDDMLFLQNKAELVNGEEGGICVCGTRGWICPGSDDFTEHDRKIYERELIRLRLSLEEAKKTGASDIICALHYPPTNERFHASGFTDLLSEYGVRTCVYGHLHGRESWKRGLRGMFGGVDYKLVSLDHLECRPLLLR